MREDYQVNIEDGVHICTLRVEKVDVESAPRLEESLVELLADQPMRFVLEMGKVKFLDSAGLQFLILLHNSVKKYAGKAVLVNIGERIAHVLKITQIEKIFHILPNQEAALRKFSS